MSTYGHLISAFLTEVFTTKYVAVTIPFIFIISCCSCCTTSIYYKKKINKIIERNKKLPDVLSLINIQTATIDENQDKLNKYLNSFLSDDIETNITNIN
jgi:hypothetical protein